MTLAAVVLAAGAGTRLRPLTDLRPKALCPVNNVPLADLAVARVRAVTSKIAVNAHHRRDQLVDHLAGSGVHLSIEEREALGTAGAIGHLRPWLAGDDVLVVNADAWQDFGLEFLLDGWDGERIRLAVVEDRAKGDFGLWRFAGASLLPAADADRLPGRPGGLYELCWQPGLAAGRVELCPAPGRFFDCGTPSEYLAANLAASGGMSVIGPGADVRGEVVRSVVWPRSLVERHERLVEVIRAGPLTVAAPQLVPFGSATAQR